MNLKEMVKLAVDAGACSESIKRLNQYNTVEEALNSKDAPYWCYWYSVNVLTYRD